MAQNKECRYCGTEFFSNSNNHFFCSPKCVGKNRWALNKDKFTASNRERVGKYEPGKIQCLICERWYKQVGSHIFLSHEMTAREYRREYGFDLRRGQLSPELRQLKSEKVFENGTVLNLEKGATYRFKKGHKRNYKRSLQTLERLSRQGKEFGPKNVDRALASRGLKRKEVIV